MATVTSPVMLDSTGQQIVGALNQIGADSVHYTADAGKTESQKAQARANIGAGTSSFSGSYNDLTDQPAITHNVKFNGSSVLDESNEAIITVNPNQTATPTTAKLTKLLIGNINYMLQGGGSSVYNDIFALVTDFNSKASGDLETGWNLYIRTRNVPDLWVSKNDEEASVPYTYTTDSQFVADLSAATDGLQIGYYRVDQLETEKVTVPVQDARINNVSAVVGGVFNVPKASDSAFGVIKTWQGTQAQYDAISTKDPDTYYFIKE